MPAPRSGRTTANSYDPIADSYADFMQGASGDYFRFQHDLVIPNLLRVCGEVAGLRVLDAGCGEGTVSRLLHSAGAQVTGIDISSALVERARRANGSGDIDFRVADLSRPLADFDAPFDLVISNLVLTDVPDYEGYARTLAKNTREGGCIVCSLTNPYAALIRKKADSYFDRDTATVYEWSDPPIYHFHRTVDDYIRAFSEAGALLSRLHDLEMSAEMAERLPAASRELPHYELYSRYPFFVIFEFVKTEIPGR